MDFLDYCYGIIINDILSVSHSIGIPITSSESLTLIKTLNCPCIKVNYNEEGLLHSKYLEDRYEPAITIQYAFTITNYYLFDGHIKDCVHPFIVAKYLRIGPFYNVIYYSSERMEQELPLRIREYKYEVLKYYCSDFNLSIAESPFSHSIRIAIDDYEKQNYTLHDCMEPQLFKFAD